MIIRSTEGHIIAEVRFTEGVEGSASGLLGVSSALFRTLRFLPRNLIKVDVNYPSLSTREFFPLNEYRRRNMDIAAALADNGILEGENSGVQKPTNATEPKRLFVAPNPSASPEDGVLDYSTIETVFDIERINDRTVVLFRDDQLELLKCLCENQAIFNLELTVLSGVPQVDYSADFENATWALKKVAYVPFISELRLAADLQSQLEAQKETAYDREKAGYTRKTGLVKEHKNFELLGSKVVPEGGDDEDVE